MGIPCDANGMIYIRSLILLVDLPNLDPINTTLRDLSLKENDFSSASLAINLPELTHLYLSKCSISTWPDVYGCPKLMELDLSSNDMTSLPTNHILPSGNALEKLFLRNNKFADSFRGIIVENLDNLKLLHMDNCGMTVFPNISLVIDTLTAIRMNKNKLTEIDPWAMLGVENFTSPAIPDNGYPKLITLEISKNRFNIIPSEIFGIFSRIKTFKMADNANYITQVPNFYPLKDSLQYLELQGNKGPFTTFNYETSFRSMSKLKSIKLQSNELAPFPFSSAHILTHLPSLTSLVLSNNLLESLPDLSSVGTPARGVKLVVRQLH